MRCGLTFHLFFWPLCRQPNELHNVDCGKLFGLGARAHHEESSRRVDWAKPGRKHPLETPPRPSSGSTNRCGNAKRPWARIVEQVKACLCRSFLPPVMGLQRVASYAEKSTKSGTKTPRFITISFPHTTEGGKGGRSSRIIIVHGRKI